MTLRPLAVAVTLASISCVALAAPATFNRPPRIQGGMAQIDPRVLQQGNPLAQPRKGELNCLITDVNHIVGTAVRFRCHQGQDGVQFIDLPVDRPGAPLLVQALAGSSVEGRTIRIAYEQSPANPRCNGGNACAVLVGTQ